MKTTRSLINGLVACGLAFTLVSSLTAQTVTEGVAKVIRIKGAARYTTGNNIWKPLNVGDVLRPGSVIQTSTEAKSYVDILLGDAKTPVPASVEFPADTTSASSSSSGGGGGGGSAGADANVVRITENSALGIDKLTAQQTGAEVVTDTQLDLKAGSIMGSVKKMSAASRYEVKLPNGVAGIRGTYYVLSATGVVKVVFGSVIIAWVDANGKPQTKVVNAGEQFDPKTGKVSAIPPREIALLKIIFNILKFIVPPTPPISYNYNGTIYHVSPTSGSSSGSSGSSGGGSGGGPF